MNPWPPRPVGCSVSELSTELFELLRRSAVQAALVTAVYRGTNSAVLSLVSPKRGARLDLQQAAVVAGHAGLAPRRSAVHVTRWSVWCNSSPRLLLIHTFIHARATVAVHLAQLVTGMLQVSGRERRNGLGQLGSA